MFDMRENIQAQCISLTMTHQVMQQLQSLVNTVLKNYRMIQFEDDSEDAALMEKTSANLNKVLVSMANLLSDLEVLKAHKDRQYQKSIEGTI